MAINPDYTVQFKTKTNKKQYNRVFDEMVIEELTEHWVASTVASRVLDFQSYKRRKISACLYICLPVSTT